MVVLDDIHAPSGRELVTNRPAWRVRVADDRVVWAFVEVRNGQIWITGYPRYGVERARPAPNPVGGAVVGAGAGALIGGALGGPPGALVGGLVGLLFGGATERR